MRYEDKIIEYSPEENDFIHYKQVIANIEFSEGDLIQMRDILRLDGNTLWAKSLLHDIELTLSKSSFNG